MMPKQRSDWTVALQFEFDRYREYRRLEKILADRFKTFGVYIAAFICVRLWVELGYQAVENEIGRMPKSELEFWYYRTGADAIGISFEECRDALLKSELLQEHGPNHFMCRMFHDANHEHLRTTQAVLVIRDRDKERYDRIRSKMEKKTYAEVLKLPPDYFADVDGNPVTLIEMNSAIAVIRNIDAIQRCPQRSMADFTMGLIHDAVRFRRRFGSQKAELIMRRFFIRRNAPGVPKQAEQILANIDEFLIRIEPDEGWVRWANLRENEQHKKSS